MSLFRVMHEHAGMVVLQQASNVKYAFIMYLNK